MAKNTPATGPKTPEGNPAPALNARRHGLASRDLVLPDENRQEFLDLLAALRDQFQPQGLYEDGLVVSLAAAQWRLFRLARLENGLLTDRLEDLREDLDEDPPDRPQPESEADAEYDQTTQRLGRVFWRECSGDSILKLLRYENTTRRAYYKTLRELEFLQARRAASQPPDAAP